MIHVATDAEVAAAEDYCRRKCSRTGNRSSFRSDSAASFDYNVAGRLGEVYVARECEVELPEFEGRDPGWDLWVGSTRVEVRTNFTVGGDFYVTEDGVLKNPRKFRADAGSLVWYHGRRRFEVVGWLSWGRFLYLWEPASYGFGGVRRVKPEWLLPMNTLKEWRCVPSPFLSTPATVRA